MFSKKKKKKKKKTLSINALKHCIRFYAQN